jgi:hypothetical protein
VALRERSGGGDDLTLWLLDGEERVAGNPSVGGTSTKAASRLHVRDVDTRRSKIPSVV